jgi:phospho-N-acetylmuramoyl-pentapeptide-transferase
MDSVLNILLYFILPLAVTAILTHQLIPYFHRKQFGQYIREEGPQAHLKKQGTPTMGGLAIVIGIAIGLLIYGVRAHFKVQASCCGGTRNTTDAFAILLTMLLFGVIGFVDDYNKIAKKENLGLTAKQKLLLQALFSIVLGAYMLMTGRVAILIPFFKIYVRLGILYVPFVMFVEIAMSNAVNLTDGLDGLASGVTAIVGLTFAAVGWAKGSDILMISGLCVAGALVGFLIFNHYPAKIFMGDTGSMALGGILSGIAVVTGNEFLLPLVGLIYVLEALSVIIQITYFRKTGGKRFFRMAPLHHHFELGGMKEYNVVYMFCAVTAVLGVITYFAAA